MNLESLEPIGAMTATELPGAWLRGMTSAGQDFGSMLVSGVESVDRALQTSQAAITAFAIGDNVPPHQVMLAMEEARLQLQFALQVRSKIVEGYQELMRMQI